MPLSIYCLNFFYFHKWPIKSFFGKTLHTNSKQLRDIDIHNLPQVSLKKQGYYSHLNTFTLFLISFTRYTNASIIYSGK